jgi:transposase
MDDTEVKALQSLSKRDLIAIILQQRTQIEELSKRIERLEEELAKSRKDSSNSSKPPSSDIVRPPKDRTSNGPGKQGGQRGHRGANRTPFGADQIDRIEELHPSGGCPHGHDAPLEPVGEPKIQQVVKLREDPLEIIEYRSYGYRCPVCAEMVWAQLPPGVVEGQLFDWRLQALIAYMKGALHASYSNLQAFCRDVLGIEVARSHLCNTIARVNEALAAPHEELQEYIPTEPVLNIDESGWKDRGLKYWIWVFCAPLVSFFHIARSRGAKVLKEILGETYGGTIVSDFFSPYVSYANLLQQFCLAHLIRDIKFLTTLPGAIDQRFGGLLLVEFKRLFHCWHLREKVPKDRFDRIMFRIKERVLRLAVEYSRGERSKPRTLARRLVKHGDAIFRFLFDPDIPPTNNAAERGIRVPVIDRRITQGSRSLMGRQWNARIWTVLGTCRKQGRSAWQFLQDALSAHYGHTPAPSLLPQAQ